MPLLLLTTYYLLLTTCYLLLTTHYSLLTTYYLLPTTYYLLLTIYVSRLTPHSSLLTTYDHPAAASTATQPTDASTSRHLSPRHLDQVPLRPHPSTREMTRRCQGEVRELPDILSRATKSSLLQKGKGIGLNTAAACGVAAKQSKSEHPNAYVIIFSNAPL